MKFENSWFHGALAAVALALAPAALASNVGGNQGAQGTQESQQYTQGVQASDAVMIKVPIKENGEENTVLAEMRLITNTGRDAPADYAEAFNAGQAILKDRIVQDQTVDGSKSWWYGWNNWYGTNWYYNYYNTYSPYYSYYYGYGYPYYYNYSYPSYYDYYGSSYYPYYGYRYYWYARR